MADIKGLAAWAHAEAVKIGTQYDASPAQIADIEQGILRGVDKGIDLAREIFRGA